MKQNNFGTCPVWGYVAYSEEHELGAFQNKVNKTMFRLKKNEVGNIEYYTKHLMTYIGNLILL
jgi:hypothetical protein